MSTSNSQWKTWALGITVALVGSLGAYLYANVQSDLKDLDSLRERVTVVEVKQTEQQRQASQDIVEIKQRLERMEGVQVEILQNIARMGRR